MPMVAAPDPDQGTRRALCIGKIQNRYRHYRAIKRGYIGLGQFTLFILWYVYVLNKQHRAISVCGANSAFQTFFEKLKTDLKVTDSATLFGWLSTKVVPPLLKGSWTSTSKSGQELSGRTALDFYHVLGGIVITSVKVPSSECFRGNPCFATRTLDTPYYNFSVPGKNGQTVSIPYYEDLGGYSVSLPSATDDANRKALLTAYKPLFGLDTQELWLHTVVFNPSGDHKTVTSVKYGAKLSSYGSLQVLTDLKTIPYHMYPPKDKVFQIICEISFLLFGFMAFVRPVLAFEFSEPQVTGDLNTDRERWFAWHERWKVLPLSGGRPLTRIPIALYFALFVSVCIWLYIGHLYSQLSSFDQDSLDWLFEDPLANTGNDISAKIAKSLESAQLDVLPFMDLVEKISWSYNTYFYVHALITFLMTIRIMEYFKFQKRLSAVGDTFSSLGDDLAHIGIIFLIVCFLFGVIGSLAFGAYDPAFTSFTLSFGEMVLVCFGMFKPAASSPFAASLFKYSPHASSMTEGVTWVPIMLQVCFKTLVILLLFKLLMGVIMSGYKKHAKVKGKFPTVRQDIIELSTQLYRYLEKHVLRRPGFVDFEQVVLALGQYKPPEDKPWEKFYIGLDHKSSVRNAMNSIFSPKMSARVKHEVEQKGFQECTDEMADYVLNAFGQNRRHAELQFSKTLKEEVTRKLLKEQKPDPESDRIFCIAQGEVSNQLEMLHRCRLGHGVSSVTLDAVKLLQKGGPTHAERKAIFKECDVMGLGTIEHEFMPQLIQQFGFQASTKMVVRILQEHDFNEDGDVDFEEFESITKDEQLLVLYSRPRSSNIGQETEEGRRRGNHGSRGGKDGIETPLLQTDGAEITTAGSNKVGWQI